MSGHSCREIVYAAINLRQHRKCCHCSPKIYIKWILMMKAMTILKLMNRSVYIVSSGIFKDYIISAIISRFYCGIIYRYSYVLYPYLDLNKVSRLCLHFLPLLCKHYSIHYWKYCPQAVFLNEIYWAPFGWFWAGFRVGLGGSAVCDLATLRCLQPVSVLPQPR